MHDGRSTDRILGRARRWVGRLLVGALAVLGLVALVPAAPAAALCGGRSWFGGLHHCPASVEGVLSTRYGEGRRVWLDNSYVKSTTSDAVLFSWARLQPCPGGAWSCPPTYAYVEMTVPWAGDHRPTAGKLIRLYGTTTTASLVPVGYVTIPLPPPCTGDYC